MTGRCVARPLELRTDRNSSTRQLLNDIGRLLLEHGVSTADQVPTAMHYLGVIPPLMLKREADEWETRHQLRYGLGAGIDPDLHRQFEERFKVLGQPLRYVQVLGKFRYEDRENRDVAICR